MQNARRSSFLHRLWLLLPLSVILAACAPTAGIFASGSWQAGTLQQEHIRSLAIDPNNAQNIYAGDAHNGVFVSGDGGTSWKQQQNGLPSRTTINALVFDDSGKKLYAASDGGLYVSADGAKSWTEVAGLPQDNYTAIAFDLKKTQSIYVGSEQHGVFASSDSGTTWRAANSGLPTKLIVYGLAFDSEAQQLWAATSMGVYRSPDGGASWQALNSGLPTDVTVYAILPASIQGGAQGLIYAGTNKGFYISQDSAAHWHSSQTRLTLLSIYGILVDYHTATTVYIATGTVGVLRSVDSGESWTETATGLPSHQTVYAMAQGTPNYDQLFVAINNLYLYPGTSSIFDPSRLLPILLVIAFFYILFRMSSRRLSASRSILKRERIIEPEDTPSSSTNETNNLTAGSENTGDKNAHDT